MVPRHAGRVTGWRLLRGATTRPPQPYQFAWALSHSGRFGRLEFQALQRGQRLGKHVNMPPAFYEHGCGKWPNRRSIKCIGARD